jgi:hypothetical protein
MANRQNLPCLGAVQIRGVSIPRCERRMKNPRRTLAPALPCGQVQVSGDAPLLLVVCRVRILLWASSSPAPGLDPWEPTARGRALLIWLGRRCGRNREQVCGSPEAGRWPPHRCGGAAFGPGSTNGSHNETRYCCYGCRVRSCCGCQRGRCFDCCSSRPRAAPVRPVPTDGRSSHPVCHS